MNFTLVLENGSLFWYSPNTSNDIGMINRQYTAAAQWTPTAVIRLILTLTFLVPNAALLVLFLAQSRLRQSAFNVYLINLLTCNILYGIFQKPPDILNDLYAKWWPFGSAYCTVYLYFTWLLESGMRGCHGLITLNRLWAVLWPNSYRIRHSRRIAVMTVIGMWIYLHAILLPGNIEDALYYRLPLGINQCWTNMAAQPIWASVANFLAFNLFEFIVVLAFPVIYHKRNRYLKSKINALTHVDGRGQQRPASKSDEGVQDVSDIPAGKTVDNVDKLDAIRSKGGHFKSSRKHQNGAFQVLMVLTASVTICWTPAMVYYWILSSSPDTYVPPLLDRAILILLSLQTTLDPLLFVVALPDVRRTIIRLFKKRE